MILDSSSKKSSCSLITSGSLFDALLLTYEPLCNLFDLKEFVRLVAVGLNSKTFYKLMGFLNF